MNFSRFLRSTLDRLRYGPRVDPARDWLVLITLGAILFAGILAWNIAAFDTVASGGVIGSPFRVAPQAFSRSSLDEIQKVFTDRAAEEAKYQGGTYRFADPSQ